MTAPGGDVDPHPADFVLVSGPGATAVRSADVDRHPADYVPSGPVTV